MPPKARKNPFTPNTPISPEYFAGRTSELEIVQRAITQTRHGMQQNLLITGERGIGKSSLARYARYIGEQSGNVDDNDCRFISSYYTLEDKDDIGDCCRGLIKQLSKNIGEGFFKRVFRALKSIQYSIKFNLWIASTELKTQSSESQKAGAIRKDFVDILKQLWDSLPADRYNGLLLILDELNKINETENLGAFFKKVSEDLVNDEYPHIMFMLIGFPSLPAKLSKDDPSVVRVFEHVELDLMSEQESEQIINKALTGTDVSTTPQVLEELIHWSEGHPYFLQQMCFDIFAVDTDNHLDIDDFTKAIALSVKQFGRMFFAKPVRELEGTEAQSLIELLAQDDSRDGLSHQEIQQRSKVKKLEPLLAQLVKDSLVKETKHKNYKLYSRALMLYVRIRARSRVWQKGVL